MLISTNWPFFSQLKIILIPNQEFLPSVVDYIKQSLDLRKWVSHWSMYNFSYEYMTFLYIVHVYMFCNVVLYCIALPARVLFAITIIILFCFLHFKTKIPKKKDMVWICGWSSSCLVYATKAYWTFVLFHFSWNKIKNNKTIIVVKGPLPPSREGRGATFYKS
jgi:hypothetical protein